MRQGISGAVSQGGTVELRDVSIASPMALGHVVVVSLDGKPLASSGQMLLQVMSEEKSSHFQTESLKNGLTRIVSIGRNPWEVKDLAGTVRFKRGAELKATPLDFNGYPKQSAASAAELKLDARTMYYLISTGT